MYYYTVSSLPYLQLDGEITISVEEFLEACRPWLKERDMQALESTRLVPEPEDVHRLESFGNAQRAFYVFEAGLRNELVRLRAASLGWEALDSLVLTADDEDFTGDAEIAERAREAYQQESPLEAERQLDRARWAFLDDLAVGHYFDLDTLVIYYLKLLIMDRRIHMSTAEGTDAFETVYDRAALKIEAQNMAL
jgi:hypothetical protein